MKQYYISIEEELDYEAKLYAEELLKEDWPYIKEEAELFLIHAFSHLFETSVKGYEVLGSDEHKTKYSQFYLNLAVGLELLLKSILLKKGIGVNRTVTRTIPFSRIIERHLDGILSGLSTNTLSEMKATLMLINEKRNNIAHRSKRIYQHYAHEYRVSYATLYIYERFFYGQNEALTKLLLKSIERSRITVGTDFKPMRLTPRSLRRNPDGE